MKYVLWLLAILAAVLVACGGEEDPNRPLNNLDFELLCKGQVQPRAAAYTPETPPNPIMILTDSTIGAQYDDYSVRYTSDLPSKWFPQIVDGTFDYSPVELVACIHRANTEKVDTCEFEDDYLLDVFDSTYEVSVFVAQTGEKLANETVVAQGSCPSIHMFDEGDTEDVYYADISEAQIEAVIEPFMR